MKRIIALVIILIALGAWATRLTEAQAAPAHGAASSATKDSIDATSTGAPVEDHSVVAIANGTSTNFRVVNTADGTTVKDLPVVSNFNQGGYPALSSDGKWIYFMTGASNEIHNVERQNVDSGLLETVALDAQQPAISWDGTELAFARDGKLVVQTLADGRQSTLPNFTAQASGDTLAGVRSIAWIDTDQLALLTSSDFVSFHVVVVNVGEEQLEVDTVRDGARGQVIGPGQSSDSVTVVDDMSNGLFVHDVALSGPGIIKQRAHTNEKTTVWDVTSDGQDLVLTSGADMVRRAIDNADDKTVMATNAMSAGF